MKIEALERKLRRLEERARKQKKKKVVKAQPKKSKKRPKKLQPARKPASPKKAQPTRKPKSKKAQTTRETARTKRPPSRRKAPPSKKKQPSLLAQAFATFATVRRTLAERPASLPRREKYRPHPLRDGKGRFAPKDSIGSDKVGYIQEWGTGWQRLDGSTATCYSSLREHQLALPFLERLNATAGPTSEEWKKVAAAIAAETGVHIQEVYTLGMSP